MALAAQSLLVLLLTGFTSVWTVDAESEAVDDGSVVLLLQTSAGMQRHRLVQPEVSEQQQSPADRLEAALPLVYVHVPKTGSSILNAFMRLPGVCPELVEELGDDSFSGGRVQDQFNIFREAVCDGLVPPPIIGFPVSRSTRFPIVGFHQHLGNETVFNEHYDGHAVTMLRQPEQRVISGMRHMANSSGVDPESVQFSEGCTVRLLVGENPDYAGSDAQAACFAIRESDPPIPEVSADDVAEAVARIRRFAFVGIQEEWHLSVCLLHAMFGGQCHATEFMNSRPGEPIGQAASGLRQGNVNAVFTPPDLYDTSILGGWVDAADRAVYDAGLEMFQELRDAFGVTPESCQLCYHAAGLM